MPYLQRLVSVSVQAKNMFYNEWLGSSQPLSVSLLAEIVASAIKKINEAEVFTESLRNELSKYSFQQPEEESFEFTSKELTLLQYF